jgi:hypothetical protein
LVVLTPAIEREDAFADDARRPGGSGAEKIREPGMPRRAAWLGVEDRPRPVVLGIGPGADLFAVAVLEPPVRVDDLDTVDDVDDVVGAGRRSRRDRGNQVGAQLPRFPAFGFVPWFAFEVRAFIFFLAVFFDIGV